MARNDPAHVFGSWSKRLVAVEVVVIATLSALLSWYGSGKVSVSFTVIVTLSFLGTILAYRRAYRQRYRSEKEV